MAEEFKVLPRHIAFIMDGNRRWAKENKMSGLKGHDYGSKIIGNIMKISIKYKIEVVTLYAFSTENWNRPKIEVNHLLKLLESYFLSSEKDFMDNGIKLNILGDYTAFPKNLCKIIENLLEKTKNNNVITLNLALNYGARDEILRAVNSIIRDKVEKVDDTTFKQYLYTKNEPDPDLVVRTSGEQRLSNFLLYQLAYAELYFTDVLWPDFNEEEYVKALTEFQKRNRRFGGA